MTAKTHPDNVPVNGDTVHDGVCVQTHSHYSTDSLVQAYRAAYIAGEIVREVGGAPQLPASIIGRLAAFRGRADFSRMYDVVLDGFEAGVMGQTPLGDMQIVIHYD